MTFAQTLEPARSEQCADRARLTARVLGTRAQTERLAAPLSPEDQTVQSMADASPAKWHRAHTTWFFETFVLAAHGADHAPFHPRFGYLFNSYYEAIGPRHERPRRGLLTRPSAEEVTAYRQHVDAAIEAFAASATADAWRTAAPLLELGIHHEQQHQELLLTDILHLFAQNPLKPAYLPGAPATAAEAGRALEWMTFESGQIEIGHDGNGFAYDNEGPRHVQWLRPFRLARRPVTNGEWLAFIADGGYRRPELWLSDGWATAQAEGWTAPLYWWREGGGNGDYHTMTLRGQKRVEAVAPVTHISYYEADAYARWAGKRLPTESEWETAASDTPPVGNTLGGGALRPLPANAEAAEPARFIGDVWEWTQSPYLPYPGFRPAAGAVGEYNGKFMCNQFVLRGGSCVTPDGHVRTTYRNFFYPHQRWQFTGLRLADDA